MRFLMFLAIPQTISRSVIEISAQNGTDGETRRSLLDKIFEWNDSKLSIDIEHHRERLLLRSTGFSRSVWFIVIGIVAYPRNKRKNAYVK